MGVSQRDTNENRRFAQRNGRSDVERLKLQSEVHYSEQGIGK
jgi:hypothetical protein